jgi:DNA invertase Pin-like site-specific DNA recombinase
VPQVAVAGVHRPWCRTLLADGYICVSAERPSATSIHRHHIVRWADGHGWRLARVVEDPVPTERGGRRAELGQALERVESRESDGIVVARLKSIGSSLDEALDAIERIQPAGGRFVSVCDGVDLGTRSGQSIFRLLVSVARW